jgi:branched-chain amino acid transport system permease protein
MLQMLADGLVIGSIIALGAIGLSMTLSIVRFSNFSHGELLGWGAYLALVASTAAAACGSLLPRLSIMRRRNSVSSSGSVGRESAIG